MKTPSKSMIAWIVMVVGVVIAALLGVRYPLPPAPDEEVAGAGRSYVIGNTVNALSVLDSDGTLTVAGASTLTGNVSAGGTLAVTGNTTLGGTLGVTGAATLAGLNKLTAGTSITVTNGAAFAVTATMQPITAAGAVTPTLTIPAAGVYACVYNTSSNAILIQDTGNQVLTAAATLGQYDMLCGYSDGTRFIETSRANN